MEGRTERREQLRVPPGRFGCEMLLDIQANVIPSSGVQAGNGNVRAVSE